MARLVISVVLDGDQDDAQRVAGAAAENGRLAAAIDAVLREQADDEAGALTVDAVEVQACTTDERGTPNDPDWDADDEAPAGFSVDSYPTLEAWEGAVMAAHGKERRRWPLWARSALVRALCAVNPEEIQNEDDLVELLLRAAHVIINDDPTLSALFFALSAMPEEVAASEAHRVQTLATTLVSARAAALAAAIGKLLAHIHGEVAEA